MKELKIKNVLHSTKDKLAEGAITMREARETLYHCGWFNYLPSEAQVTNLLNSYNV